MVARTSLSELILFIITGAELCLTVSRINRTLIDAQNDSSVVTTSQKCSPDFFTPFCWWAIDLVTATKFTLYRNGMSDLLDRNIQLDCGISLNLGKYGFSFMNITTDIPYVDVKVSGRELKFNERQKVLAEVIYYCCKLCTRYENKKDEEIIEDLVTEFYKRRPFDSDFSAVEQSTQESDFCINIEGDKEMKTLGGSSCMFMLDVNTPAKAHAGAMHWNKINLMKQSSERENNSLVALASRGQFCAEFSVSQIPDGECVRYASLREYFVLCCCYNKPQLCAYSIAKKSALYMEENRKVWETRVKVRNPMLADEIRMKAYGVKTKRWIYRDFLYSKLLKMGTDGQLISTGRNIPLWHCAVGHFTVYDNLNISTAPQLEILERKKLPPRTQYCIADIFIDFQNGRTELIMLVASADTEEKCTSTASVDCQLVGPECLNDLIYDSQVQAEYRCCCNRGNLCNHWGNNNPSKSEYQINLKPEDFHNIKFQCHSGALSYLVQTFWKKAAAKRSCWRSFEFLYGQEIIMIDGITYQKDIAYRVASIEPITGYMTCEILNVYPLRKQNCHRRKYFHQEITYQFFQCECRFDRVMFINVYGTKTCDQNMDAYFARYKDILPRPACYEMYGANGPIAVDMYSLESETQNVFAHFMAQKVLTRHSPVCVNFVKFTAKGISFGAYALRPARSPTEAEQFRRFMSGSDSGITVFMQHCQSNVTQPCNDFKYFFDHLLPMAVHTYAREREPASYSRCFVSSALSRETCQTTFGCFDFHSVSGLRRRGCIEDIPQIVKENPGLEALKYCIHAEVWRMRSHICNAVRDIRHPRNHSTNGVLCCCKGTCPLSNQNLSPTSIHTGFNNFETV